MAKVQVAYADRLKALQADSDLFRSLKDFVHDLKSFKNNKRARLRLSQDPVAGFYMSSAYFSPEQAQVILSFEGRDGVTLEQSLQSRIAHKLQTTEGEVSSARYELCTSHFLAPIFQEHFTLGKV